MERLCVAPNLDRAGRTLDTGDGVSVPEAIRRLATDCALRSVWRNEAAGVTFDILRDGVRRFVKWQPHGDGPDLAAEAARLEWAASFTTVPHVLGLGRCDDGARLLTAGLEGSSAVSDRWRGTARDTSTSAPWALPTAGRTLLWPAGVAVWNFGAGWGAALLRAYGVEPDLERIAFYRLLWDLAD
jgi:aminoglycoside phosphotransferase